jgi:hypothetical protein
MSNKVLLFGSVLTILAFLLGVFLGMLDFWGFMSGEHTLNLAYLALALITWHLLGLTIFLLDLAGSHNQSVYLVSATVFGMVFYVFNHNPLSAALITLCFFVFQLYTQQQLFARFKLFVNFSTREVVFPVIRRSFLFLMVMLLLVGFFQGQGISQKGNLVTPALVRTVTGPAQLLLKRQFPPEIRDSLGARFVSELGANQAPQIAHAINQRLLIYLPFLPFVFGLLVLAFVSPLITLSEWLLLPVIRLVIRDLIQLKVITITHETVERETLKL